MAVIDFALLVGLGRTESQSQALATKGLIREEQEIVVNGVRETWRLEWKAPPTPTCGVDDVSSSMTCPCIGFAYGESGQLDLVRTVGGHEIDRMELTVLFGGDSPNDKAATIQRWEFRKNDDEQSQEPGLADRVRQRPLVKIMQFADYNHDGNATEFFLQTGVEPCGKRIGVVVGLTRKNWRLHAIGSALHPDMPLVLQKREWEALRKARGPVEVLDWPCGDHGADAEDVLRLKATSRGIEGVRFRFQCTESGKRGALMSKEPF